MCVCVCARARACVFFLLLFSTPPFLEGTQVSGRWRQDGTRREPGESLEGAPGSGSSQVLSWSTLDKRKPASSICSPSLCLITTRCPYVRPQLAATCRRRHRRHGRWKKAFGISRRRNYHFLPASCIVSKTGTAEPSSRESQLVFGRPYGFGK